MEGSKLVDGKVIAKDGFNLTDASIDEKMEYMDKIMREMANSIVQVFTKASEA